MTKRREFLGAAIAALFFPDAFLKDRKPQEIMDEFEEFRDECFDYSRGHLDPDHWEDFEDYLEEGWQIAFEELIENETKIGRFPNPPQVFSGCVTAHTAMVMSKRKVRMSIPFPGRQTSVELIHHYLHDYGEEMLSEYRELV